jgi:hypothetical protein
MPGRWILTLAGKREAEESGRDAGGNPRAPASGLAYVLAQRAERMRAGRRLRIAAPHASMAAGADSKAAWGQAAPPRAIGNVVDGAVRNHESRKCCGWRGAESASRGSESAVPARRLYLRAGYRCADAINCTEALSLREFENRFHDSRGHRITIGRGIIEQLDAG